MSVVYWILITFWSSKIVVEEDIFRPVRDYLCDKSEFLYSMITCMKCFPVWVGFIYSIVFNLFGMETPSELFVGGPIILRIFMDGVFTSLTTWIMYNKLNKLL